MTKSWLMMIMVFFYLSVLTEKVKKRTEMVRENWYKAPTGEDI